MTTQFDPVKEAMQLREQLASPRRHLGFFLGAGTSMAVGLPGVETLTNEVQNKLPPALSTHYANIRKSLGDKCTVEHILNRVRLYRELLGDSADRSVEGLNGLEAKQLDMGICLIIAQQVNIVLPGGGVPQRILAQWCRLTQRDYPVEFFTTNYDLLLEQAMEELGIPFFDGFVGSVRPFFAPETVEADGSPATADQYPPRSWLRLWKVHGSIGWHISGGDAQGRRRIVRAYKAGTGENEELLIYPSRDKYEDSRKQPFLSYQDRLRRFLASGEVMLLVAGYSFGDQHLNELLYQGLRANNRLHVVVLSYADLTPELARSGTDHRNLTILAGDKACVGGIIAPWNQEHLKTAPSKWPLWDAKRDRFALGDFNMFARYLEVVTGFATPQLPVAPTPTPATEGDAANAQ